MVRRLWAHRDVDAPASSVWAVLTDVSQWARWGPSVRHAELDVGVLGPGATGTITTAVGVRLRFEITDVVEGERWTWSVAGIPATEHTVQRLESECCRVGFSVPWAAAPYLGVCHIALARIDDLAREAG